MVRDGVPLLARVECRSEGSAEERPVAVWLGGRRHRVEAVLEDQLLGAVRAGAPNQRRVRLELDDGSRLEARRAVPDGEWRVWRERTPGHRGRPGED